MSKITVIGLDGNSNDIGFGQGDSLMEVLRDAGYDEILAMCGGCCSCATCHVHIENQGDFDLAPVEEDEQELISMSDNYDTERSRLSCQISLDDAQAGMTVSIIEPE